MYHYLLQKCIEKSIIGVKLVYKKVSSSNFEINAIIIF